MLGSDDFVTDGQRMVIFTYSTAKLVKKDKIRFYYALKGRDGKSGIVKEHQLIHLGKGVILAPARFAEDMEQFFKMWNLPFTSRNALVGSVEDHGSALLS